jgi:hypothetical protein
MLSMLGTNDKGTTGSSNVTSVAASCATTDNTVFGISGVGHVPLLDIRGTATKLG